MFEREVKFIYDFNSNKVKKLGPSATFTELLPLGIHPAILQYISAEIEFRVFEDRQTLLKHSMFDYSGPKITSVLVIGTSKRILCKSFISIFPLISPSIFFCKRSICPSNFFS